jgi:hypothetical protein
MANQTVSVNRNMDDAAIAGLVDGDDITIDSGAKLTINSDSRWGQQAAVIGNITINATTGGSVLIDGRDVWWVAYDGGTGTVPALSATVGTLDVTRAGTPVAEFLGVFTALGVVRTAAAAAMPATGFLKFRRTTFTLADNDVLTLAGGATATVNSTTGGQRGWLHIVGESATTINVPRLGLFEVQGDWFELGLTNGADSQTFQFPVQDYCNGVQIETAAGSGIYEWWPAVGTTRWAQTNRIALDARGKACNSTALGVIQIALRGAVQNGFKPPTGCRVRVPNILTSSAITPTWSTNVHYGTTAAWDFTTTNAGAIYIKGMSCTMFVDLTQPFSVEFYDSTFQNSLAIRECGSYATISNCCVGLATTANISPITFQSCFSGGLVEDTTAYRYEQEANSIGVNMLDCDGFTYRRNVFSASGDNVAATLTRGATTACVLNLTRVTNSQFETTTLIGGGVFLVGCTDVTFSGVTYADRLENGTTQTANGVYIFSLSGVCTRCFFEGPFANVAGLANMHAYNGFINFVNAYDCELFNIGTPDVPYDCGSANAMGVVANFGGNDIGNICRRIYVTNSRVGAFSGSNISTGGKCINVWADQADAVTIPLLNFECRGGRMALSATGQVAIYGTHWSEHFTADTAGVIRVHCNEPTTASADQCAITQGTPRFTSTGSVAMPSIGDRVEWTLPYFALGHNSLATFTSTGTGIGTNILIEFQWDKGAGYNGTWTTLSNANLVAVGALDPAVGVKLKIRATTTVAAATNIITYLNVTTVTTLTARKTQYPLPGVVLTLTGLVEGSEVRAYVGTDPATAAPLAGVETSTTEFAIDYTTAAGQAGFIVVFALGYQTVRIPITYPTTNSSIPVQQALDRVYSNS